jgi:malate permease and related proteins
LKSSCRFSFICWWVFAQRRWDFFPRKLNDDINKLMFRVFLPTLLFKNLYMDDLAGLGSAAYIPYAMLCTVLSFLALFVLFSKLEKEPARRGVLIQGAFRGNSVLYGLPVAMSIFGDGNTAEIAIVLAAIIPIYNILSVIVLEVCGKAASVENAPGKAFFKILRLEKHQQKRA